MEADKGHRWFRALRGYHLDSLHVAVRILADHHPAMEAGGRSPEADREHGRSHLVSDRAPGNSRTNPRPRKVSHRKLLRSSCREDYDPNIVPAGAAVIIGAVDVQDNRLEAEISAWGLVEVEKRRREPVEGMGQSRVPRSAT